jgi:hypothetical protein
MKLLLRFLTISKRLKNILILLKEALIKYWSLSINLMNLFDIFICILEFIYHDLIRKSNE